MSSNSRDSLKPEKIFSGPKIGFDGQQLSKQMEPQSLQDLIKSSLIQQDEPEIDFVQQERSPNNKLVVNNRMAKRMLTRKNKGEVSQKLVENQVFKDLARERLVKQFKRNLFMKSYIMSDEYKNVIQNHFKYEQNSSKRVEFNQQKKQKKIFLIPGSIITLILDLVCLIIKITCLWVSPLIVSFFQHNIIFEWFQLFVILSIFLEIFIQLNRPVNVQGETITHQSSIFQNYIKNYFIEDLIDIGCWIIQYMNLSNMINGIVCMVIILVSFKKMMKNYANCIETMFLKGTFNYALDIFTLTVTIVTFAHIMGCIFHYVGFMTISTGESWLLKYEIYDQPVYVRYNVSLYWAIMTMVTVGYGDITPTNQYETLSVNIMMLFSSGMFAYLMNSIGMILKASYDAQQKYKRSLILINNYMNQGQLNQALQNRVRNYVKHYLQTEFNNENFEEVKEIISHLPNKLRQELTIGIQMNIMQHIPILNNNFSSTLLKQLSYKVEQIKYIPDEIVYNANDQDDQYLYYLHDGQVQVCEERSSKVLQIIKAGDTFGEYQFFTGFPTKNQVISLGHSQIYRIHRNSLLKLFNSSSNKDFQRFHNIKDSIVFLNNYQVILKKCNICNLYNHAVIDCPLLSYQPDRFRISMKPNPENDRPMIRKKYKREGFKINSLQMNGKVIESVQEFTQSYSLNNIRDQPENPIQSVETQNLVTQDLRQFAANSSKLNLDLKDIKQPSRDLFNYEKQKSNQGILKKPRASFSGLDHLIKKKQQNITKPSSKKDLQFINKQQSFITKEELEGGDSSLLNYNQIMNGGQQQSFNQLLYLSSIPQSVTSLEIDQHYNFLNYMPNDNLYQALRRYDKSRQRSTSPVINPYKIGGLFNSMDQSSVIK